jgi:zinc and cadmium transporter
MFASLSGVIFVTKSFKVWTEKNLNYLVAFASGVFLVVIINLFFEALEFADNNLQVLMFVITGFLIFLGIERLFPEVHHHHDGEHCGGTKRSVRKVMLGDALHNLGDGILLAPVFIIDIHAGIITAIGIFVHEAVMEISEFFVLKASGMTTREALIKNFLVSGTILIGAIGGFYLSSQIHFLVAPLIGLATGAFLYILIIDLVPESVKNSHKEKKYFNYIFWVLLGILLITAVNFFASHGHAHI